MNKIILALLILLRSFSINCQTKSTGNKLNFDFEIIENEHPTGWEKYGSSIVIFYLDSVTVRNGKYSAVIENKKGTPVFRALGYSIRENYDGKKITLSGYIKTENVTDGYAGLWMRIDPFVAFNNMEKTGIRGTTGWTKYEITSKMNPAKTEQIIVGGLLAGRGKMWIDELKVTIDGKDINELKPFEKKSFPAGKDREFDGGSQIKLEALNNNQIKNIKTLGLVWGFLKYYHPDIANGEFNWDYELFRVLPDIVNAKKNVERDTVLLKWIIKLGAFGSNSNNKIISSEVKFQPDLDWIINSDFSTALTSLLLKIRNANRPNRNYYIGLEPGVGNPEFKNENAYSSMKYPDAGFRILSLFRYWNFIQYFFPYKNLIEEDWKNVLEEFIPKVVYAKHETEYTLAILELIGRVHDTHANIWNRNQSLNKYFGENYAAAEISFVENKAVVTGFYDDKFGKESGLKTGDVINKVNDKPVEEIIKEGLKYTPASNYSIHLKRIAANLLRTNDSLIKVGISASGRDSSITLKTYSTEEINIYCKYQVKDTCFGIIEKDIAYIHNGYLKREYLPDIWENLKNTKGLILDLRNYPSDFPLYALSDYLMPKSVPFVKFTNGSIKNPGLFTYYGPIKVGRKNKNYYKGKVVVLINEDTQSSAEFHAMAYRVHPNATIIGSTTAGADGNVSEFYLPGGIYTIISGIGVYYPDGKETQRIGIIPDIEIKPTIEGIKNGRDELLEKAIEIINGL
ncbi:MAG: peptidase S41 [Bacteroidetes bacterium]|nr:peptidase S41 [Bacteroidota bacterium]